MSAATEDKSPTRRTSRASWAEGRSGGVYVPPFRVARQQAANAPSDSDQQRLAWEALKKRLNGLINKVNVSNLTLVIYDLFEENLVRGTGLFCRSVLKAQLTSPEFTNVYASLVCVVNSKIPELGELFVVRVLAQFRRGYKRSDRILCMSTTLFIAHLVNQCVIHELVALQLVTLLLEKPTDDSVEVAISFIKACGAFLTDVSPTGMHAIFERMRFILQEGYLSRRTEYTVEAVFSVRRNKFEGHPTIIQQLDLVDDDDKITHETTLDDELDLQTSIDVFRYDDSYKANEAQYARIREELLGDSGELADDEDDGESDNEDENQAVHVADGPSDCQPAQVGRISDMTEGQLVAFRRTVYLTIMSALSHEEASHKLVKLMRSNKGYEKELCGMMIECCSQERSYLSYYGLLGVRFCQLDRVYANRFEEAFAEYYATIHRYETGKIRNIARFFGAVLYADALPWTIFEMVKLTEEETTSSSRIFLKVLFQELAKDMGVDKMRERLEDPEMAPYVTGLFPRDDLVNVRFSINYFTNIDLGALTDASREFLRTAPRDLGRKAPSAPEVLDEESSEESSSLSESSTLSSSSHGLPPSPTLSRSPSRNVPPRHALPPQRGYQREYGSPPRQRLGPLSRGGRLPQGQRNEHVGRGRGRGRGVDMTKPAWAKDRELAGGSSPGRRPDIAQHRQTETGHGDSDRYADVEPDRGLTQDGRTGRDREDFTARARSRSPPKRRRLSISSDESFRRPRARQRPRRSCSSSGSPTPRRERRRRQSSSSSSPTPRREKSARSP